MTAISAGKNDLFGDDGFKASVIFMILFKIKIKQKRKDGNNAKFLTPCIFGNLVLIYTLTQSVAFSCLIKACNIHPKAFFSNAPPAAA